MNDVSVQVIAKRIRDIDATCMGRVNGHLALNALLGFITGYVPGNVTMPLDQQRYVLERTLSILQNCVKQNDPSISVNTDLLEKKFDSDIRPLFYEKH